MKTPLGKAPQIGTNKPVFNYSNLIMQKDYLKISFEFFDRKECFIQRHSIIKIFTQLNNSIQSLEQICIKYITCAISNEDTSEFETSDELSPVYVTLLNTSKSFFCNANIRNPAVMITDFSLKKIVSLLGETIVGMSDYISIAIFVFSEDELHIRFKNLTKLSLRANILSKYAHNNSSYPLLNGRFKVPVLLPHAEQNPRIDISDIDFSLDNVEAHLDHKQQKNRIYSSSRVLQNSKLIGKPVKYVKKNKSRPRFSGNKNLLSPFISSCGGSRQNSKDFIFMDNNNFDSVSFAEDDIQVIPGRLKATPKPRVNNGSSSDIGNNEEGILPKEYYAVYDLGLERRLIPEEYIEMTIKALNELIVKSDNINLYDNKRKIARLSSNELKVKNKTLDDIWIELKDINDNIVYVKRRALEDKIKTHATNDLIKIDDFEGNNVFIKNNKGLFGNNSNSINNNNNNHQSSSFNRNSNNASQKKFFVVRLAKIEINNLSTYYNPLNK